MPRIASALLLLPWSISHLLLFLGVGAASLALVPVRFVLRRLPGARTVRTVYEAVLRRIGQRLLADARDWPMLATLGSTTLLGFGSYAVQWFELGPAWPIAAVIHWAVLAGPRYDRYIQVFSVKHNEAHRKHGLFRGPARRVLGRYTEHVLGPLLYGNIPGLDTIHHVRIHHREDGGPADPQRTIGHDASRFLECLRYLTTRHLWVTCGGATMTYLVRRRRYDLLRRFGVGLALFYGYATLLALIDPKLALVCVVVPALVNNFMGGLATWLQHAFHPVDARASRWANTITMCFATDFLNEGYHLAHHHRASLHWTELPAHHEAQCRGLGGPVFRGIDWFELWLALYLPRGWKRLAERSGDAEGIGALDVATLRARLVANDQPTRAVTGA